MLPVESVMPMGSCCEPVDLQCLTLTLDIRLQAEAVEGMKVMFGPQGTAQAGQ